MRDKKVCSKYLIYNYTELDALKEYLEEMALKGWILIDINTRLIFKKAEPQKINYSVEIDKNANFYDRLEKVNEIENVEDCLNEDWVLITGFGILRVYIIKNENAISLIKNEKEKLETIVRSTLEQRALIWFVLPLILITNVIIMNITQFNSINHLKYFGNAFYIIFYVLLAAQIISFLVWKKRRRKELKKVKILVSVV